MEFIVSPTSMANTTEGYIVIEHKLLSNNPRVAYEMLSIEGKHLFAVKVFKLPKEIFSDGKIICSREQRSCIS